jgi:hypothetical protein
MVYFGECCPGSDISFQSTIPWTLGVVFEADKGRSSSPYFEQVSVLSKPHFCSNSASTESMLMDVTVAEGKGILGSEVK